VDVHSSARDQAGAWREGEVRRNSARKPTALNLLQATTATSKNWKARTRQISTLATTNTTQTLLFTTHTSVKMENDRGELVDL